jgi:hypothetical protein
MRYFAFMDRDKKIYGYLKCNDDGRSGFMQLNKDGEWFVSVMAGTFEEQKLNMNKARLEGKDWKWITEAEINKEIEKRKISKVEAKKESQ